MLGRLRRFGTAPSTQRAGAGLGVAACSLACSLSLLLSIWVTCARAVTHEDAQVNTTFSCLAVTFSYSDFPDARNKAHEIVTVDGQHVVETEFAFDGAEGASTVAVHVAPGHHRMDAHASWKVGSARGGRDMKLRGGIRCSAEPGLAAEELQRVSNGSESFTAAPLSGWPGEVADYQVTASNTGNVGLQLTAFTDPYCDPGTVTGAPAGGTVVPGGSVSYRCEHVLTAADQQSGVYASTAAITAAWSDHGSGELTQTSNTVLVYVSERPHLPAPPQQDQSPPYSPLPGAGPAPALGANPVSDGGVLSFGASAPAAHCTLSLASRSLSVNSKGRASLRLLLVGVGTCRGRLALTAKQRVGAGQAKVKTIAAGTFSLAAGHDAVLVLALNKLGRGLLGAGHGRLEATLTIVRVSPGPLSSHSAGVRLSVVRPHKH